MKFAITAQSQFVRPRTHRATFEIDGLLPSFVKDKEKNYKTKINLFDEEEKQKKRFKCFLSDWRWYDSHIVKACVYWCILQFWAFFCTMLFIWYEKSHGDELVLQKQNQAAHIIQTYNLSHVWKNDTFREDLDTWSGLPDTNEWDTGFQHNMAFTWSLFSTIGWGTYTPQTDNGKFLVIWGGLLGISLLSVFFMEMFYLERTCCKLVIRFLDWQSVQPHCPNFIFLPEKIYTLLHFLIVSILIFISCILISSYDKTHQGQGWTTLDSVYAYFQVVSTVGFGDYPIWVDTHDIHTLLDYVMLTIWAIPLSLFPLWIIYFIGICEEFLKWFARKCCGCNKKVVDKFCPARHGLQISRADVWHGYMKRGRNGTILRENEIRIPGIETWNQSVLLELLKFDKETQWGDIRAVLRNEVDRRNIKLQSNFLDETPTVWFHPELSIQCGGDTTDLNANVSSPRMLEMVSQDIVNSDIVEDDSEHSSSADTPTGAAMTPSVLL